MALGYLISPVIQTEDTNGKPLTGGWINVFKHGTQIPAVTYKDFHGDMNPNDIVLDHKGMCIILADEEGMYDVYCYDRNGVEQWSRLNLGVVGGAGGAAINITSTDNSIHIEKIIVGGVTNFDISNNADSPELLEWIRCDGATKVSGSDTYRPTFTSGTMQVGTKGIKLYKDRYYHVTAHVRATKNEVAEPWYDKVDVKFIADYGNSTEITVTQKAEIIDYSLGLSQEYEVSTDIMPVNDCELLISVTERDLPSAGSIALVDVEAHRIYSGAPYIPGGVADKDWVEQNFQPMLTAGENIYIDPNTWTISAAGGGGGGGSEYISGNGIIVNNTQHSINIDPSVVQTKLTAGDNITIVDGVISSTGGGATYTSGTGVVVNNVDHTISLDGDVVIDANYVHTDNNYTTTDKNKLDGIEAGAEANVQSDWNVSDNTSDAFIRNKPTIPSGNQLVPAATSSDEDKVLTVDSNGDPQWETPQSVSQVQSDWTESDSSAASYIRNKPNLATVATSGSYNDLSNQPTIPSGNQLLPSATSADENKVLTVDANGDPEWANAQSVSQVQSDWTQTNNQQVDYIRNKPTVKALIAGNGITITETSQGIVISLT